MKTLISKVLVTAGILALSSASTWAAGDEKAAPKTPAAGTAIDRVVSQMWWNQSLKVTTLALTGDQRSRLDALGRAYLEARRDSTAQSDALAAFSTALKKNDFAAAREQAKVLAQASAQPHLAQAELMIDGLSVLSAEQREKLAANFPGLLEGPWMRTGANLRQRRSPPAGRG